MSILENIRNQKIEELKTLNANIQAILNECAPKAEQLAQDIADLTEAIGDGGVPEEPQE